MRAATYISRHLYHAQRNRRHDSLAPSQDLRRTQRLAAVVDEQPRLAIHAEEWTDEQLSRLLADVEG